MAAESIFNLKTTGVNEYIKSFTEALKRTDLWGKSAENAGRKASKAAKDVNELSDSLDKNAKRQKKSNDELDIFGKRLSIALRKVINYRIAFGVFSQSIDIVRGVIDNTIEMDEVMGDLRKVLFDTADVFEILQKKAFDLGKEFGRTGQEVARGFLVFAQQGLSLSEILERTRAALFAVSASTLTMEEAVESLTAVTNNFTEFQNNAISAVDKWAKVAATAPVTAKDLADAVLGTGAAARQVGVDLDELNGIVAAIAEVTRRSGKNIGNALKTILARAQRPDVIKQLDDLGIASLSSQKTFRSFADVLVDLSKEWEHISDVQKFNFAVAISGVRQYNNFLALMKNFGRFLDATSNSQQSLGFAQKATEAETAKLSRQMQSLLTVFQELAVELGEAGLFEDFISAAKVVAGFADSLRGSSETIIDFTRVLGLALLAFVSFRGSAALAAKATTRLDKVTSIYGTRLKGLQGVIGNTVASNLKLAGSLSGIFTLLSKFTLIFAAVSFAVTAYEIATSGAERQQKRFNETVKQAQEEVRSFQRDLAAKKGSKALNEFLDTEKIKQFIVQITDAETKTQDLAKSINNLSGDSGGLQSLFDFISETGITGLIDLSSIVLSKGTTGQTVIDKYAERVSGFNDEMSLTNSLIDSLNAQIRKLQGQNVLPQELNAFQLERNRQGLQKVNDALSELQAGIQGAKGVRTDAGIKFSGLSGVFLGGSEISPKEPGTIRTAKEFKAIEGSLQLIKKALKVERLELKKSNDASKDLKDNIFEIVSPLTKAKEALIDASSGLETFNTDINRSARLAELLNDPFNLVNEKINRLKTLFRQTLTVEENFVKEFKVFEVRAKAAGLNLDNLSRAIKDGNPELLLTNELIKTEGVLLDEALDVATKIIKSAKEKNTALEDTFELRKLIIGLLENEAVNERDLILARRNSNLQLLKTESLYDSHIQSLKSLNSEFADIGSINLSSNNAISKYRDINSEIAQLEFKKAKDLADQQYILDLQSGTISQIDAETRKVLSVEKARLKLNSRLQDVESSILKASVDSVKGIGQSLSSAIASSVADFSNSMVRRRDQEKQLEEQKINAEKRLADARAINDKESASRAILTLRYIEDQTKKIGNIFTDIANVFSEIVQVRMQTLSQQLSTNLLSIQTAQGNLGDVLSLSISDENVKENVEKVNKLTQNNDNLVKGMSDAIDSSSNDLSNSIQNAAKNSSSTVGKTIEQSHKEGANSLSKALEAGFKIGAVLIGQTVGGGGRGAAIGANLGGFGADFLSSFFKLSNPLTAILSFGLPLIGGLFVGLADREDTQTDQLTNSIDKNTRALENNNRLLELTREFINAPTNFIPPPVRGSFSQDSGLSVVIENINVNGNDSTQVTETVVNAVTQAIDNRNRRTATPTPFGR